MLGQLARAEALPALEAALADRAEHSMVPRAVPGLGAGTCGSGGGEGGGVLQGSLLCAGAT